MIIPSAVLNAVTKLPTDNDFIYGAEALYTRMKDVEAGVCSYICPDMATLANMVEMYYKGMLASSGLKVDSYLLEKTHSLSALHSEISTRIVELSPGLSKTDRYSTRKFLDDLSAMYIDARYHNAQPTFEEFKACFAWAKKQREIIMSTLDPERSWDKDKSEKNTRER